MNKYEELVFSNSYVEYCISVVGKEKTIVQKLMKRKKNLF